MVPHDPILDAINHDLAADLKHVSRSADDPSSDEPVLAPYATLLRSLRAAVEVEMAAEDSEPAAVESDGL